MLDLDFVRLPQGVDDAAAGTAAAALIWADDQAVRGIADPRTPAFAHAVIDALSDDLRHALASVASPK